MMKNKYFLHNIFDLVTQYNQCNHSVIFLHFIKFLPLINNSLTNLFFKILMKDGQLLRCLLETLRLVSYFIMIILRIHWIVKNKKILFMSLKYKKILNWFTSQFIFFLKELYIFDIDDIYYLYIFSLVILCLSVTFAKLINQVSIIITYEN